MCQNKEAEAVFLLHGLEHLDQRRSSLALLQFIVEEGDIVNDSDLGTNPQHHNLDGIADELREIASRALGIFIDFNSDEVPVPRVWILAIDGIPGIELRRLHLEIEIHHLLRISRQLQRIQRHTTRNRIGNLHSQYALPGIGISKQNSIFALKPQVPGQLLADGDTLRLIHPLFACPDLEIALDRVFLLHFFLIFLLIHNHSSLPLLSNPRGRL